MSDSRRLPLIKAEVLAWRVADAIRPHCRRLEIAGSIRRRRAFCGDIDLVCLPSSVAAKEAILARCSHGAKLVKGGEQYVVFELSNGFQLDLWFAHDGTGDLLTSEPSNFGALLLARTGSAMHNVYIAERAHTCGLHFNPHRGLLRRGQVVASAEEADLFAALKLDLIPPERRERS